MKTISQDGIGEKFLKKMLGPDSPTNYSESFHNANSGTRSDVVEQGDITQNTVESHQFGQNLFKPILEGI